MCEGPSQRRMLLMFNDHFLRTLSRSRVDGPPRPPAHQPAPRGDRRATHHPPRRRRRHEVARAPGRARLAPRPQRRAVRRPRSTDGCWPPTSIDTGAVIADPFEHTAAIVELLQIQARAARPAAALPAAVDQRVEELLPEAA